MLIYEDSTKYGNNVVIFNIGWIDLHGYLPNHQTMHTYGCIAKLCKSAAEWKSERYFGRMTLVYQVEITIGLLKHKFWIR